MIWRLRRAEPGDGPALSLVAAASFLETFAGIIAGPDMVRHCTLNSAPAKFEAWIADAESVVTLVEHPDGAAPVGYTLLVPPDLPIATVDHDIELRRIYALSLTRGTGLGHKLMAKAIDDARAMGKRRMLLGVLGINAQARAFYEREGFTLAGERQFRVGDTVHNDVVYGRAL